MDIYLIWRTVHSTELLKVLFDGNLNILKGLSVIQPFSLHQLVEKWL